MENIKNPLPRHRIQISGRLIRKKQFRGIHQGTGDRSPLLLSSGKFVRAMPDAMCQPYPIEQDKSLFTRLFFDMPSSIDGNITFSQIFSSGSM